MNIDKLSGRLVELSIVTQKTISSIVGFCDEYISFKNRYHPFVWWLYDIGVLK